MKDVRIFYKKHGPLRFVSHLDMNRYLSRLIRLAGLPVWYTEGFHQHLYLTFALPLSLGFSSDYEAVDIRLTDDELPLCEVQRRLNERAVEGLEVFAVGEPKYKPGQIGFCRYRIDFLEPINTNALENFLNSEHILIQKRNKKGKYNEVDIAPKIKEYTLTDETLMLTLSAGNDNLNPVLLLDEFFKYNNKTEYQVTRKMLYTAGMEQFL